VNCKRGQLPSWNRRGGPKGRGGRSFPLKILPYHSKDVLQIFEYLAVFKPQDHNTLLFEVPIPFRIKLLPNDVEVRRAIQLHRQAHFRTKKVESVRTYAVLSTEFLAGNLSLFQLSPQTGLRRRERVAEFFAVGFKGLGIVDIGFHQVGSQQLIYHPGATRHPSCSRRGASLLCNSLTPTSHAGGGIPQRDRRDAGGSGRLQDRWIKAC
jgi:hypothetical protein